MGLLCSDSDSAAFAVIDSGENHLKSPRGATSPENLAPRTSESCGI
jgi:hypothetical protein